MITKSKIIKKVNFNKETLAISVLSILYLVGILGIALPIHKDFALLTPFNLLISLGIMLAFHPNWDKSMMWFLLIAYLVGFFAEMFGVQTGLLFGNYEYGRVLGIKIWDTPLIIGVNWVILTYASGVIFNTLLPYQHWLIRSILAALLMVGLDILIEPVAMDLGFWSWENDIIPLRNYMGWFLVALPLLCIFNITQKHARNKVAIALFILQVIFFLVLNIL
ncbi:MAG: carotenoid biosynthesis protein [Saprospiraceae bacterium]|nr:carotenoid biosynthesis protein [Saprospiraceae bacterium]